MLYLLSRHLQTRKGECDMHHKDKHRDTPVHLAGHSGSVPVLELLVGVGGDAKKRNRVGGTPLEMPCLLGRACS